MIVISVNHHNKASCGFVVHLQELIWNKAKSGQSCCLIEDAFSMVSSLPWRAENMQHVSLIENYPAPLKGLGEPIRQVGHQTVEHQTSTRQLSARDFAPIRDLSVVCRPRVPSLYGRKHPGLKFHSGVIIVTSSCSRTVSSSAKPKET